MFSEKPQTDLAKYMKEKTKINYLKYKLPNKILNNDNFTFGICSEKGEIGTKELIQIDKDLKIPKRSSSKMSMISKRNYHYDWKSLKIDPNTFVFGRKSTTTKSKESVANSLKFTENKDEWNKPLNPKKKNPMPHDFVYGLVKNKENCDQSIKQCIYYKESEFESIKTKNKQILTSPKIERAQKRMQRISAKDLINPSKYSEIGIYDEEYTKNREFDDIVSIYNKSGYKIDQEIIPRLKQILASKYENICSLNNINQILKSI